MVNGRGATLERVAQGAALLALCAALIACAMLFFPWHRVDRVEPRAVREMFQLPNPARGALPREEVPEQHDFVTCTGLDHLAIGGWPVVILLAGAFLAGLAWRAKTRRGNIWLSLGSVIMSLVFAWLGLIVPIFSHFLETEGPTRLAEKVFDAALTAAAFSFVLSAALRVALLVVRRRRTQG
ncbi:MAG TPA: hypothetical protein VGF76_23140 [Polyangiaceae bacterium]